MQDILDDDQDFSQPQTIDKREKNPRLKSVIYLIIMFLGSIILLYVNVFQILQKEFLLIVYQSVAKIILIFLLSLVIEFFRFLIRKGKKKESPVILVDPFWFQVTEGAFGIWIIFAVFKIAFFALVRVF